MSRKSSKLGRARKDGNVGLTDSSLGRDLTFEEFIERLEEERQLFAEHKRKLQDKKYRQKNPSGSSASSQNSILRTDSGQTPEFHPTNPSPHMTASPTVQTVSDPASANTDRQSYMADINDIRPNDLILDEVLNANIAVNESDSINFQLVNDPPPPPPPLLISPFLNEQQIVHRHPDEQQPRTQTACFHVHTFPSGAQYYFDKSETKPDFDTLQQLNDWWTFEKKTPHETTSFLEYLITDNSKHVGQTVTSPGNIQNCTFNLQHLLDYRMTGLYTTSQVQLVQMVYTVSTTDRILTQCHPWTSMKFAELRHMSEQSLCNGGPKWRDLMTSILHLGWINISHMLQRTLNATKVSKRFVNLMCPVALTKITFQDMASKASLLDEVPARIEMLDDTNPNHVLTYNAIYNRFVRRISFITTLLPNSFLTTNVDASNQENCTAFLSITRRLIYYEKFCLLSIDMTKDLETKEKPAVQFTPLATQFKDWLFTESIIQMESVSVMDLLFDVRIIDILQKLQYSTILFPVRSYHKCPAAMLLRAEGALHASCFMFAWRIRQMQLRHDGGYYDPETLLFKQPGWTDHFGPTLTKLIVAICKLLETIQHNTDLLLFAFFVCGSLPARLHFPDTEINRRVMMCVAEVYFEMVGKSNADQAFDEMRKVFTIRVLTDLASQYLQNFIRNDAKYREGFFDSLLQTALCPQQMMADIPEIPEYIFNPVFLSQSFLNELIRRDNVAVAVTRWDHVLRNSEFSGECYFHWSKESQQPQSYCTESKYVFSEVQTPTRPRNFCVPPPMP